MSTSALATMALHVHRHAHAAHALHVPAAINSSVLLIAAPLAAAVGILWMYEHALGSFLRRVLVWSFAALAALLVVGITVWQDALASLVAGKIAMAVLLAVDVAAAFALIIHAGKKKSHEANYHPVWSHAIAVVGGTALALTIGDGINLLRQLSHAPAGTGSAMAATVSRIQSGRAGHAVSHGQGEVIVAIALAVLVFLIILARKRKGGRRQARPAGKPLALPQGGGGPQAPLAPNLPARKGSR